MRTTDYPQAYATNCMGVPLPERTFASNGLAYPHDDICFFQSQHGHHARCGYFADNAMPWSAVAHLLCGGTIEVIDASQHRRMTDALRFGVATWCRVFNAAVCRTDAGSDWETPEMRRAANQHAKLRRLIRRLWRAHGCPGVAAVCGQNVLLTCHQQVAFDDKIDLLCRRIIEVRKEARHATQPA